MTRRRVVIVGAGMGGLTAALRLAQLGHRVQVLEARSSPGGLASGVEHAGLWFDGGPYILLDRPGLEWVFERFGARLDDEIPLDPVEELYQVTVADGEPVRFYADLARTAAAMDRRWPGAGRRYNAFVDAMLATYRRAAPLLFTPPRRLSALCRGGIWRDLPFLLRSLDSVLARSGLPREVAQALGIWTHIAGQAPSEAPSAMALVPALIHTSGAWLPRDGIGAIPRVLALRAAREGVEFHYGTAARAIRTATGRVVGVETEHGAVLEADAVVSNSHGVGTYLQLLDTIPAGARARVETLPLQSPGVCACLRVRGVPQPPYLKFWTPRAGEVCRLFIAPGVVAPAWGRDGWWPARLLAPLAHREAETLGRGGQREVLCRLLEERWWQEPLAAHEVLATRVPAEWGAEFRLYRDSMNPVMTARMMRRGRLPHRSPVVGGLYLAGSSSHPGQWVSFCAISGILAADALHGDLA